MATSGVNDKKSSMRRISILGACLVILGAVSAGGADSSGLKTSASGVITDPAALDPSYGIIDSAYFLDSPPFDTVSNTEIRGYYLFRDGATQRWIIGAVVPSGAILVRLAIPLLRSDERRRRGRRRQRADSCTSCCSRGWR